MTAKDLTLQTTASGDTSRVAYPQGATHTPGPWRVEYDGDWYVLTPDVVDGTAEAVDELLGVYVSKNPETREANARLIAQSPALLAAAKAFVAWVDDVWGSAALSPKTIQDYENAKAAILAAEGSDRP